MTGYAAVEGQADGVSWSWEIRGVNARGLDLRLRLPDRVQALDKPVRDRLGKAVKRGSITVSLRLKSDGGTAAGELDAEVLDGAVAGLVQARNALDAAGLPVAPVDPSILLSVPGIMGTDEGDLPMTDLLAAFDAALSEFQTMRAGEGLALGAVLSNQLNGIAALVDIAATRATARSDAAEDRFRAGVTRLMEATGGQVDEARLAQELATLMVKGDVAEEIDRLQTHIAAARELIGGAGPVGRKLDFLMQEFNREANTLCSKSQDAELTRAGLDLKVTIDQMREQVQNLE